MLAPLDIVEYKRKWWPGHMVNIHSDLSLSIRGKAWCKKHLQNHEWSMSMYTNVYEHTFYFEKEEDAIKFKKLIDER